MGLKFSGLDPFFAQCWIKYSFNSVKISCICKKYVKPKDKSRIYIKIIDQKRNYFIEEIKQNDLMSKKHKKSLHDFKNTLSTYTLKFLWPCDISISAFASLVGVPICIACSAVGPKICVITARIKKYQSIIKKKKKVW